jgi:hypothetical protein
MEAQIRGNAWSYSKTRPRPPSLDLTFIQLITKVKLDSKFEGRTTKAASEQHVFLFPSIL